MAVTLGFGLSEKESGGLLGARIVPVGLDACLPEVVAGGPDVWLPKLTPEAGLGTALKELFGIGKDIVRKGFRLLLTGVQ